MSQLSHPLPTSASRVGGWGVSPGVSPGRRDCHCLSPADIMADKEGVTLSLEEEEDADVALAYKTPEKKSLREIQELDPGDESLRKYKQALLGAIPAAVDASVPNVQVTRLTLMCEQAPGPITMDLTGDLEVLRGRAFVLKEGVDYRVKVSFKVRPCVHWLGMALLPSHPQSLPQGVPAALGPCPHTPGSLLPMGLFSHMSLPHRVPPATWDPCCFGASAPRPSPPGSVPFWGPLPSWVPTTLEILAAPDITDTPGCLPPQGPCFCQRSQPCWVPPFSQVPGGGDPCPPWGSLPPLMLLNAQP
uniref:Rho GDP dissociation inhibitor gamma n=1 Tax=Otus sunia TaxID=257818 RepID=A0A8C8AB17_9STRI